MLISASGALREGRPASAEMICGKYIVSKLGEQGESGGGAGALFPCAVAWKASGNRDQDIDPLCSVVADLWWAVARMVLMRGRWRWRGHGGDGTCIHRLRSPERGSFVFLSQGLCSEIGSGLHSVLGLCGFASVASWPGYSVASRGKSEKTDELLYKFHAVMFHGNLSFPLAMCLSSTSAESLRKHIRVVLFGSDGLQARLSLTDPSQVLLVFVGISITLTDGSLSARCKSMPPLPRRSSWNRPVLLPALPMAQLQLLLLPSPPPPRLPCLLRPPSGVRPISWACKQKAHVSNDFNDGHQEVGRKCRERKKKGSSFEGLTKDT